VRKLEDTMTTTITFPVSGKTFRQRATEEPAWIRWLLTGIALIFLTLFLFVPLISVFYEAFKKGVDVYLAAITDPDAVSAIKLTLTVAAIAVPLNLVSELRLPGRSPSSNSVARIC